MSQPLLPLATTSQKRRAGWCKHVLCGAFRCHDEINLTIKDVKQRDLLRQAFASVCGVKQSVELRQGSPKASSKLAAAKPGFLNTLQSFHGELVA